MVFHSCIDGAGAVDLLRQHKACQLVGHGDAAHAELEGGGLFHLIGQAVGRADDERHIPRPDQKRLAAFASFRIIELPEEKIEEKNASDAVVKKALDKEGKAILSNVRKGAAIVAMCIEGRQISSDELAQFLAVPSSVSLCKFYL